jgi:photosystem II stability/assembly factor-like uncharacterized protein
MLKFYSLKMLPRFILILMITANVTASAQWTRQNSGTNDFLIQVYFPAPDTGYVVSWGPDANILKTTNGGISWLQMPFTPNRINFIYFTSVDTGYGVTDENEILKTTDGAASWVVLKDYGNYDLVGAIYFSDSQTGYTTTFHNQSRDTLFFIKTSDGGISWNELSWATGIILGTVPYSTCISFINRDTGYFVGLIGLNIFGTTDGCNTVNTLFSGSTLLSINFPSATTGYAGYDFDVILKTSDGGITWNPLQVPSVDESVWAIDFTSEDTGFIILSPGNYETSRILKTTDGGNSWIVQTQITDTNLNSIYFPDKNTGYAVGEEGVILKYHSPIGIEELSADSLFSVYPNPTSGQFILYYDNPNEGMVRIYNLLGEIVTTHSLNEGENPINFNSGSGIYFLQVTSNGKTGNKLIVVR